MLTFVSSFKKSSEVKGIQKIYLILLKLYFEILEKLREDWKWKDMSEILFISKNKLIWVIIFMIWRDACGKNED